MPNEIRDSLQVLEYRVTGTTVPSGEAAVLFFCAVIISATVIELRLAKMFER